MFKEWAAACVNVDAPGATSADCAAWGIPVPTPDVAAG